MLQNNNEFINKQVQVWAQNYVKTTFGVDTTFSKNPTEEIVAHLTLNGLTLVENNLVYSIVDSSGNTLTRFKPVLTF